MRQRKTRGSIDHISYSPSGRLLVGRDGQRNVQVWDAGTLKPVETIPADDPRERLLDCLFRPGGQRFLREQGYVGAGQDLPAGPPRPEHQDLLVEPPNPDPEVGWGWTATWRTWYTQHFACFGPDGQTFVGWNPAVEGSPLGLWRFTGELVRAFEWMSDWTVNDMGMSADGRFLAGAAYSSAHYSVTLVDLEADPPPRGLLPHSHNVLEVVWSPAASLLACVATRGVSLWDAPAVIGEAAKWEGGAGQPSPALKCVHEFRGFRKTIEGLVFSPDGKLLVAGAREGLVRVWEVESGREKANFDWQIGKVNVLAFAPDGGTVVAGGSKGIVVWDVD
jgi:WD40 repeat protein